jgi:intein/homing endonuclease
MQLEDDAPKLSVDAGRWSLGRLYHEPDNLTDYYGYTKKEIIQEIFEGRLFPSITTVLDVLNAPYLQQWAANMASKEAVRVGTKWPERYTINPKGAYNHLRLLHTKDLQFSAQRGTRIHKILELISQGKPLTNFTLTDEDKACIVSFERFVKDFQPEFLYQELSGIGRTNKFNLLYGGTTDFIAKIEGLTVAGDYKCTTLDTNILLENGVLKQAKDIKEGDKIVAWTPKRNLHIATVAWTTDNGVKPIISIKTEYGQELNITAEHPVLVNRKNKLGWITAADLVEGDFVHLAAGWNHNPHRVSTEWEYRVSPYAVGIVWAIINTLQENKNEEAQYNINADISKASYHELKLLGIKDDETFITEQDIINILDRNKPVEDATPFMELLSSSSIPKAIWEANVDVQEAFIAGVREIFAVKGQGVKECVVNLSTQNAIEQLQHLYLNLGVVTQRETSVHEEENVLNLPEDGLALRVPHFNADEIIKHGPIVAMITRKETREPERTIAIEVEEAHTHVTNGLITHNTTRSGLHNSVAIQLTAFKNTTNIFPDDKNPIPTPHIEKAIGVHISPENYKVVPVDTSAETFNIFEAMRELWFYHITEGLIAPDRKVLQKSIRKGSDLLD